MKSEFELIEKIKKIIPRSLQGSIGIGDDAGTVPIKGIKGDSPLLFTTDSVVEGVDFVYGKLAPERVGRKALAVNLSDIAAMGATPLAFVVSLGIPKKMTERWIEKFYKAMTGLAKKYGVHCVGGDISRAKEFFASIALLGTPVRGKIITRSGAKTGDWIGVTGTLGGSLQRKHWAFEPRLREAAFLVKYFTPSAMIDVSDGFVQDLEHILKASRVGARIELSVIPAHDRRAIIDSLTDGEDFELLLTLAPRKKSKLETAWKKKFPRLRLSWIGRIEKRGPRRIRWLQHGKPVSLKLKKKGYSHF